VEAARPKYNEQQLNQSIQEDADDVRAWFRLGVLQTHDGRILQAMEAFRQVIRINPNVVEPHHNLAAIYESLDDFDAAAEELKQVIALAPRDMQSQVELAAIYLKQADAIYRGIARRQPENRTVKRDHLAQLLCRQSLSQVRSNDVMEQVLQRMIVPEKMLQIDVPAAPFMVAKASLPDRPPRTKAKLVHHTMNQRMGINKPLGFSDVLLSDTPLSDAGRKQELLAAVEAWKKGWESRDTKRYFSFYSAAFSPSKRSLISWRTHKVHVLRKAKFVRIYFKQLRVDLLDNLHSRVTFDQDYQSDYYQARSHKVVMWVNENGVWRVLRETSIDVH